MPKLSGLSLAGVDTNHLPLSRLNSPFHLYSCCELAKSFRIFKQVCRGEGAVLLQDLCLCYRLYRERAAPACYKLEPDVFGPKPYESHLDTHPLMRESTKDLKSLVALYSSMAWPS